MPNVAVLSVRPFSSADAENVGSKSARRCVTRASAWSARKRAATAVALCRAASWAASASESVEGAVVCASAATNALNNATITGAERRADEIRAGVPFRVMACQPGSLCQLRA